MSEGILIEGWIVISMHDGNTFIDTFDSEAEARMVVQDKKTVYQVVRAIMPATELLERVLGKEGE